MGIDSPLLSGLPFIYRMNDRLKEACPYQPFSLFLKVDVDWISICHLEK